MRFVHTADWHLGRIFYSVHLTEDQAYLLEQLKELLVEVKPDFLVVSGDVYDRAVPPQDAVALLDDFLSDVVLGLGVPVVMIAGNHDSPERLGFGARLFAGAGLYVFGQFTPDPGVLTFEDEWGPVYVCPVPYAEPSLVRERLGDADVKDHASAFSAVLERVRAKIPPGARSVLVAHAFVQGGEASESERPLSVGGAEMVPAEVFAGFSYVALGHLHRPQTIRVGEEVVSTGEESGSIEGKASFNGKGGAERLAGRSARVRGRIEYSGSLYKYSFSEAEHDKCVLVVDMDGEGRCEVERVRLTPRRDVRCLEGTLKEVLEAGRRDSNRDDYVMVRLLDRGPVFNAMNRVREVYPNALHIERPWISGDGETRRTGLDPRKFSVEEMFEAFYSHVTGEEMSEGERRVLRELLERMEREEREVGA